MLVGDLRSGRFVFRSASLAAPSAHGRDVCRVPDFFGAVGARCELDKCVKGYIHPRAFGLIVFHEVRIDATKHCLMRNDENVFAALKLHDDGFEANDYISV